MELKKLNFIFRSLSTTEEIELSKAMCPSFYWNASYISLLEKQDWLHEIVVSEELKSSVNALLREEFDGFIHTKVHGELLMKRLQFESVYIWYYHRTRIYYSVQEFLYQVDTVRNHLIKDVEIAIFTDDERFSIFFSDDARIKIIRKDTTQFNSSKNRKELVKKGASLFYNGVLGISNLHRSRRKKYFIVVNATSNKPIAHLKRNYNPFFGKLLTEGDKKEFGIIYIKEYTQETGSNISSTKLDAAISPYDSFRSDAILLRYALSMRRKRSDVKAFLSSLKQIQKEWSSELSMIHRLFLETLVALNRSSEYYLLQHHAYNCFFQRTKEARKTIAISEYSSNHKLILDASRKNKIETVGIQHGMISTSHISYMFSKDEEKYHCIPDMTILWGENWRSTLLENSCYSQENTVVLGQLRTDYVQEFMSRQSIGSKLTIAKDKAVIMFASQPQKDLAARRDAAKMVFQAFPNNNHFQLIVKIHPIEKVEFYRDIAEEIGAQNYLILDEKYDLYELLAFSNVVITCFSTVGSEAIYFEKPLIVIDPLNEDKADYVKNNVALQVKNSLELETAVKKSLSESLPQEYKDYTRKSISIIDGKVYQRYLNFLRQTPTRNH